MSTKDGRGRKRVEAPPAALGSAVQRLRKVREMSLGELSEVSGVAKSIISQIERDETNSPSPRC